MRESLQAIKLKARRRARRVRAKVRGTSEKPRMSLYISGQHISVQCIDDVAQKTLCALTDKVLGARKGHVTVALAQEFGKLAAAATRKQGIEKVVFDRGGHAYHGRVKAFADGAREGGLQF